MYSEGVPDFDKLGAKLVGSARALEIEFQRFWSKLEPSDMEVSTLMVRLGDVLFGTLAIRPGIQS